jgi:hypothetical protein
LTKKLYIPKADHEFYWLRPSQQPLQAKWQDNDNLLKMAKGIEISVRYTIKKKYQEDTTKKEMRINRTQIES